MKTTISQAALQKYQQIHELEKKCRVQREAMRDQMIALLRAGAAVETGELDATLVEYASTTFSRAKLIEAIGVARFELLKAKITPTPQVQLKVKKRAGSKSQKPSMTTNAWS